MQNQNSNLKPLDISKCTTLEQIKEGLDILSVAEVYFKYYDFIRSPIIIILNIKS